MAPRLLISGALWSLILPIVLCTRQRIGVVADVKLRLHYGHCCLRAVNVVSILIITNKKSGTILTLVLSHVIFCALFRFHVINTRVVAGFSAAFICSVARRSAPQSARSSTEF